MPQIISIIGNSGSGKTTLIEKLIKDLKKRGHRIGTIKHASHGFDIDKKGKDSRRHKEAGADTVIVASPRRIAMVKDDYRESLDHLEKYFDDVDIILTEGYKKENRPKIEVFRAANRKEPLCRDNNHVIAFVTDMDMDMDMDSDIPVFGLEDIEKLADLIEKKYL